MKIHYRQNHAWVAKDGIKWKKQRMQIFFRGPHVRYVYLMTILILDISLYEDENDIMDYLGALIKDVIGEAEDRDKIHQATLNQVRDSQSLVTRPHGFVIHVGKKYLLGKTCRSWLNY